MIEGVGKEGGDETREIVSPDIELGAHSATISLMKLAHTLSHNAS